MKKIAVVTITILAMLFSILPTSVAQAKKDDTNVTIKVKNHTGAKVSVMLVDENGNRFFFEYGPGVTSTIVLEGHYRYYASTPCGNKSGDFNLNVTKQLFLSCGDGLQFDLTIPTGKRGPAQYCYGIYDEWGFTDGEYAYMGDHCQDTPAYVGQNIEYVVPDPTAPFPYTGDADFFNSGSDACAPEFGAAYYWSSCEWD